MDTGGRKVVVVDDGGGGLVFVLGLFIVCLFVFLQ